jgi:hypothetical protein
MTLARAFVPFVSIAILAGCTPANMAVPPPLGQAGDKLPVDGPGIFMTGDVTFGRYRAVDVHHSWIDAQTASSWGFGIPAHSERSASQEYSFRAIDADGASYPVQCRSGSFENATRLFGITMSSSQVSVTCTVAGARGPAGSIGLNVNAGGNANVNGAAIEIAAVRGFEGSSAESSDALGYAMRSAGYAVGAVQLVNSRSVWIARAMQPNMAFAVAVTGMALVLFQDPREHH